MLATLIPMPHGPGRCGAGPRVDGLLLAGGSTEAGGRRVGDRVPRSASWWTSLDASVVLGSPSRSATTIRPGVSSVKRTNEPDGRFGSLGRAVLAVTGSDG